MELFLRGTPHVSEGGQCTLICVCPLLKREKERDGLILIIGHQLLSGSNILVLSAQWTD